MRCSATIPQREGRQTRIILLAAEGGIPDNVARFTGFSWPTITVWCQHFQARRLNGLIDEPEPGRKSSLPEETVRRVLELVTSPRIGEPRSNCRSIVRAADISLAAVHKLWTPSKKKPRLSRTGAFHYRV